MRVVRSSKHFRSNCCPKLCTLAERTVDALHAGQHIFFFGNGGSAADAQHLAAEFVGRFVRERRPLPALALTANTSLLTAVANDFGYEHVFPRQIEPLANPGDLLFAMSTSGNSPNVLLSVQAAKCKSVSTVGLKGSSGGQLVPPQLELERAFFR